MLSNIVLRYHQMTKPGSWGGNGGGGGRLGRPTVIGRRDRGRCLSQPLLALNGWLPVWLPRYLGVCKPGCVSFRPWLSFFPRKLGARREREAERWPQVSSLRTRPRRRGMFRSRGVWPGWMLRKAAGAAWPGPVVAGAVRPGLLAEGAYLRKFDGAHRSRCQCPWESRVLGP